MDFLEWKYIWKKISIKIALRFVPGGRINNIPPLVQIIAWRRLGDKPSSEHMMVSQLTHICVAYPQWVNLECLISVEAEKSCQKLPYWGMNLYIFSFDYIFKYDVITTVLLSRSLSRSTFIRSKLSYFIPLINHAAIYCMVRRNWFFLCLYKLLYVINSPILALSYSYFVQLYSIYLSNFMYTHIPRVSGHRAVFPGTRVSKLYLKIIHLDILTRTDKNPD